MEAEEILKYLITNFLTALEDFLQVNESKDEEGVLYGMKSVYVETLEIIQKWKDADSYGLNFDIEDKYLI